MSYGVPRVLGREVDSRRVAWAILKADEELGCAPGSAPPGQAPVSVSSTSFVPQLCVVVVGHSGLVFSLHRGGRDGLVKHPVQGVGREGGQNILYF